MRLDGTVEKRAGACPDRPGAAVRLHGRIMKNQEEIS